MVIVAVGMGVGVAGVVRVGGAPTKTANEMAVSGPVTAEIAYAAKSCPRLRLEESAPRC
jgi:hypothetical protein